MSSRLSTKELTLLLGGLYTQPMTARPGQQGAPTVLTRYKWIQHNGLY